MTDFNELNRIINLARVNAANDLAISNEILGIVDNLVQQAEQGKLDKGSIGKISEHLVELALKLTEQSKAVTTSVTKLAGL